MTRAGAALFALLIAATCAAFFAVRVVRTPAHVVRDASATPRVFSPNGDDRSERSRITLTVRHPEHVSVALLGPGGAAVRTLVSGRRLAAGEPLAVEWDGQADDGRAAPDGIYRLHVTLRDEGRSVTAARSVVKDTAAPRPRVRSMGPSTAHGPELLPKPDGAGAVARFAPAGGAPEVLVFRTAPGAAEQVLARPLVPGATSWTWDGRLGSGRAAPPGTYLVALRWRDRAGTVGTSVPLGAHGLPVLGRGTLPGRGGVTVRSLAAQAPLAPVREGDPITLYLDARSAPFRWSLRRLGRGRPARAGGPKSAPRVRIARAPSLGSGVYLFEVRTAAGTTRVPVPVTSRMRQKVLVVLPAISWQGRNAVDDDGDGAPDTLDLGGPARLARLSAGDGLPAGFTEREAPALVWLDRRRRTYELTTDAALLLGRGPRIAGHTGVLLIGHERWVPPEVRNALRAFVRGGGKVASLGVDSLRRGVSLDRQGRLFGPSPPAETDIFGARLRPVVRRPTDLEIFRDDAIGLFAGGAGLVRNVPAWEETAGVGREADLVANAVTVDPPGRSVVVGARYGRGLVLRPGFPSFPVRLSSDPAVSALMARMWTLLSR